MSNAVIKLVNVIPNSVTNDYGNHITVLQSSGNFFCSMLSCISSNRDYIIRKQYIIGIDLIYIPTKIHNWQLCCNRNVHAICVVASVKIAYVYMYSLTQNVWLGLDFQSQSYLTWEILVKSDQLVGWNVNKVCLFFYKCYLLCIKAFRPKKS